MNAKTLLILSLLLGGCSSIHPMQMFSEPVERTPLALESVQPVHTKMVQWFVVTPENVDAVFLDLKKKKYNLVLFGLTDDGYEGLSMNIKKKKKYIIEQNAQLKAYKDYYEPKEVK